MFCSLGEEEHTRFRKNKNDKKRKKKKEKQRKKRKKKKKLVAAKSRFVGMKGSLNPYNRVDYFFPIQAVFELHRFLSQIYRGDFRVLKPKSRDLLPRNLVQTYNLLISNCCPNFM